MKVNKTHYILILNEAVRCGNDEIALSTLGIEVPRLCHAHAHFIRLKVDFIYLKNQKTKTKVQIQNPDKSQIPNCNSILIVKLYDF